MDKTKIAEIVNELRKKAENRSKFTGYVLDTPPDLLLNAAKVIEHLSAIASD